MGVSRGLFHCIKSAHLQASWAKNQIIKKSNWIIIIAISSLRSYGIRS